MSEPLEITLDGAFLEQVRAVAAAQGLSVEEWAISRLEQHVEDLRRSRAEQAPPD